MLDLKIERDSETPIYKQIYKNISDLISARIFENGVCLPSTRELAKTLGVNRSTVTRAYSELWANGFIDSSTGKKSSVLFDSEIRGIDILPDWFTRLDQSVLPTVKKVQSLKYNFSSSSPDKRIIPHKEFRSCLRDVQIEYGNSLLCYGDSYGDIELRKSVAGLMKNNPSDISPDNIIITHGSLSALDLLCKLFKNESFCIITEEPSYSEAINLFKLYGARVIAIPLEEDGINIKKLEESINNNNPDFIYIMPNFQNPTGISYSLKKRKAILEVSEKYNIPIVEDGFSQELKGTVKSIKTLDTNNNVIYLGTISKTLFPGLRVGWVTCHKRVIDLINRVQFTSNLGVSPLMQRALSRFINYGYYGINIRRINRIYNKRLNIALDIIKNCLPENASFIPPLGGYFIWIKLNIPLNMEKDIKKHLEKKSIQVTYGSSYFMKESSQVYIRISISGTNEEEITSGLTLLCSSIKEFI